MSKSFKIFYGKQELVKRIEELSEMIELSVNDLEKAVPLFFALAKISQMISEFQVQNLYTFANQHMIQCLEKLSNKAKQ